ncbi:DNA alkylation repair protein [Myxococcus sp. K15C18031901]|uniref:DNA alkylation repair protein n=1 Tax=Myxococcus dinghuensis TaxID=2906761 RepID=UPI0020A7D40D|nr:DNA alkylation repair protein [Myxococcus dinghuensis]MCP3099167.1 DNA alkylation repair protein [Myxococcus dinghuensis]
MADSLKTFFDAPLVRELGSQLHRALPSFPRDTFVREAIQDLERHELIDRARHIMGAMRRALPSDYPRALKVMLRSLGPARQDTERKAMDVFFYLPHTLFVSEHGLEHFEESMLALHTLTQRFTGEWAIRPFLERHPEKTLARLREWATDENVHVRRLVSEGTRPRLPWGSRLRAFQKDPRPVLALLELLKDDPELYVRRSVANNLNDIGKDHPEVLVQVAKAWQQGATPERQWLIRHALRFAIKRGDASALEALGAGKPTGIEVRATSLPARARVGGAMDIRFEVANRSRRAQSLVVDLAIYFVKARGDAPQPKVFKVRELTLGPGATEEVGKRVSLAQLSTRRHYPGSHRIEARINGLDLPLGAVEVET